MCRDLDSEKEAPEKALRLLCAAGSGGGVPVGGLGGRGLTEY